MTEIQKASVDALAVHDTGILVAPPGAGKTVVAAALIARRARNTLVLVHRTQLVEQWIARLAMCFGLDSKRIGQIGGGHRSPNGQIDVAMIQSLVRKDRVDEIVDRYGHVVVDECHHVPAVSFERVMREVRSRYVTGLTATPLRRDGHHPIAHLQLGPVRFTVAPRAAAEGRAFAHRLVVRETQLEILDTGDLGIQEIYQRIAHDSRRNDLILDDIISALAAGRSPIVLTERRDHLEFLAERLKPFARNLVTLSGGMGKRDRRAATEQLATIPDNAERLILATGRFVGEGFDDARLDTLFLTMPLSWRGTLIQYTGRLSRLHPQKTEVQIYDYVDRAVPMLARMFARRMRGYQALGYATSSPASQLSRRRS